MKFLPIFLLTRNNYSYSYNATNRTFHAHIGHEHVDMVCTQGQTQNGKHACYGITSIFLLSHFSTFLKAALGRCGQMPILKPFLFHLNSALKSCGQMPVNFLPHIPLSAPKWDQWWVDTASLSPYPPAPILLTMQDHLFPFSVKLRQDRVTSGNLLESSHTFGHHSVAACSYCKLGSWKRKLRDEWGRMKRRGAKMIVYWSRSKFNGAQTI